MRTTSDHPYTTMIATAAVLQRPPKPLSDRHLRALAYELAAAACDLDARMRAGLAPPAAWQHTTPAAPETTESGGHTSTYS